MSTLQSFGPRQRNKRFQSDERECLEMLSNRTQDLIGGRYSLGKEVAHLNSGVLFEGHDRKTGEPLLIHRVLMGEPQRWSEARAISQRLASLTHRNLPRVNELVEDRQAVYSLQESFQGETLSRLPVPISPEMAVRYVEQLLSAVQYLHSQQPCIVHRDIRPQSILLGSHGVLQLVGLDISSASPSGASHHPSNPEYSAPELLAGAAPDPRQDLYSVGAVALFLLTGKAPTTEPPNLSGFPESLSRVVEMLLQADPKDRPASASAALSMLQLGPHMRMPEFLLRSQLASPPAEPVGGPVEEPASQAKPSPKLSLWSLVRGKARAKVEPLAVPDDSNARVEAIRESFPLIDLTDKDLDLSVAQLLPETAARSIAGICIEVLGRDLVVAVKDPSLVYIYDHVDFATQGRYRASLRRADPVWIDRALEWAYHSRSKASWRSWVQRRALDHVAMVVANPMADTSMMGEELGHPIIESTERMIKEALAVGTSDIHMEAFENRLEIRYRIDGVLQPAISYPPTHGSAMVKRIKIMANMDVSQERVTQGGRISLAIGERKYDLRVSIVPVAYGESVVMRVLKKGSFNLTLSDLGFDPPIEKKFRASLSQPHGLILVCGPTGSGKSTTLYASLKELIRPDRKLLTVEDPVEYEMDGLVQVQVNLAPREEEQRVTFAKVLKEFLRHDPEVILVGEIRDPETASIAMQASLTGHLVLSTVHTNDSIGILSRLRDMGIKSYLTASTLRCGLAQRLARRICPSCREELPVTPELTRELEREQIAGPYRQFRGRGCRDCLDTGFRGRLGIYEVLEVPPSLRSMIVDEAGEEEMLKFLIGQGFRTLYQNGLEKVVTGHLSYDEVQRVCRAQ